MPGEFLDDEIKTPLLQLVAPDLPPLCRKVAPRPMEGLGDVEDVLLGVPTMPNALPNRLIPFASPLRFSA